MKKKILVVCESENNKITDLTCQMLSKGWELSTKIEGELVAIVSDSEVLTGSSIISAIDYVIECAELAHMEWNKRSDLLVALLTVQEPDLVLFPDSDKWRAVAASTGAKLNVGIVADCIEIKYDANEQQFVFHRTAYIGTKEAVVIGKNTRMVFGIIKKNVFRMMAAGAKSLKVCYFSYSDKERAKSHLIASKERRNNRDSCLQLEGKKVIICAGRGVDEESLILLKKIAKQMGAGLGYSRPMVECEIGTSDLQIGQSGKFVQPDVYIAFGVSGSIHHVCGITNSKKIIAVNRDCSAPIFEYSDVGIVADTGDVIRKIGKKILS
ncbi:MAG: electron transfer flavoprotein subunit alpha/FixB family protein [Velocimicrobium sp.]